MHVDARPGGTWYETLPNGGYVTHLQVMQAAPGERLVFTGGPGPLAFMAVSGSLTVIFAKVEQGTHVKISYTVGASTRVGCVVFGCEDWEYLSSHQILYPLLWGGVGQDSSKQPHVPEI